MANYMTVPGAQVTEAERRFIRDIAVAYNQPDKVILNVGIMWGCTLWCLRDGAPTAQLYGVDIAPDNWQIEDRAVLNATILQGDSRTMRFEQPIDVLLIDGDHHYDVVKADIANWLPRVKKGGTVIFHDYAPTQHNMDQFPHLIGVRQAVDEWFSNRPEWQALATPDSLRAFRWK